MRTAFFGLVIFFSILTSCHRSGDIVPSNPDNNPKSLDTLSGTLWKWYSFETQSGKTIIVKDSSILTFLLNFVDEKNLFGIAGNNDYSAQYRIKKDTLIFDRFSTDDCGGSLVKEFNSIFYNEKTFKATDSVLKIFTADTNFCVLYFKRYIHFPQKHLGKIISIDIDIDGKNDFVFDYSFKICEKDTVYNILTFNPLGDCAASFNKLSNGTFIDNRLHFCNNNINIAKLEKHSLGWEELWDHQSEIYSFNIPIKIKKDGEYHYGWTNVTMNPESGKFTLNDYSYNPKPNEGIVAGMKMK